MSDLNTEKDLISNEAIYQETLFLLRLELAKLQDALTKKNDKVVIIFEGRDASGKDGTIRRITKCLNPKAVKVKSLDKPTDREKNSWYFQRFVPHLPAAGELVFFNRSWYNRAGVEKVMGFCTEQESHEFMEAAPEFESGLVRSGIKLLKYYLDISKEEQKKRIEDRCLNPLKQWKMKPTDKEALSLWEAYSEARNIMFAKTHSEHSPWTIVRANDKKVARLNIIKDMLRRLDYNGKNQDLILPSPDIIFNYDGILFDKGIIEL